MTEILVLGASGFIGTYLCRKLKESKDNIIYGVSRSSDKIENCDIVYNGDLRDTSFCEFLFKNKYYDEIYQLAADSGNLAYLESKQCNYGDSTLININIIKATSPESTKKFLFTSSAKAKDLDTAYGVEKFFNELLYQKSRLPVVITRLHNIFGIWDKQEKDEKVLNALCRRFANAKDGDTLFITCDYNYRSFVPVEAAVDTLLSLQPAYIVYEITSGSFISIWELCNILLNIAKKNLNLVYNLEPINSTFPLPDVCAKLEQTIQPVYNYYQTKLN